MEKENFIFHCMDSGLSGENRHGTGHGMAAGSTIVCNLKKEGRKKGEKKRGMGCLITTTVYVISPSGEEEDLHPSH